MAVDAGDPDAIAPDAAWSELWGQEAEQAQRVCTMPTAQDIYEQLTLADALGRLGVWALTRSVGWERAG